MNGITHANAPQTDTNTNINVVVDGGGNFQVLQRQINIFFYFIEINLKFCTFKLI